MVAGMVGDLAQRRKGEKMGGNGIKWELWESAIAPTDISTRYYRIYDDHEIGGDDLGHRVFLDWKRHDLGWFGGELVEGDQGGFEGGGCGVHLAGDWGAA